MRYRPHSSKTCTGAPDTARRCILIVDDNPMNMKLFTALVAAQGHQALQASDGFRGLDLAHQHHPDLIIMDIQLPGMSGLEAIRNLKADPATRDIPVIITTASEIHGDEEERRASGGDGFIAKPVAISEFLELVEGLMARSDVDPDTSPDPM